VVRIEVPPLRHHLEDLPALSQHLLSQLAGGARASLAPGEIEELARYDWPGNTRELRNVLERALVLQAPAPLRPSLLLRPRSGDGATGPPNKPSSPVPLSTRPLDADSRVANSSVIPLVELERRAVLAALDVHGGNRAHTAKALGMSVATLRRKLREYGLGA